MRTHETPVGFGDRSMPDQEWEPGTCNCGHDTWPMEDGCWQCEDCGQAWCACGAKLLDDARPQTCACGHVFD